MAKDVNIEYTTVQVPITIEVDGKTYPLHKHNFSVVRQYEATKDEAILDNLVTFHFNSSHPPKKGKE